MFHLLKKTPILRLLLYILYKLNLLTKQNVQTKTTYWNNTESLKRHQLGLRNKLRKQ